MMASDFWRQPQGGWNVALPQFGQAFQFGSAQLENLENLTRDGLEAQARYSRMLADQWQSNPLLPPPARLLLAQSRGLGEAAVSLQETAWSRWFQWLRGFASDTTASSTEVAPPRLTLAQPAPKSEATRRPVQPMTEPSDLTVLHGVGPAIASKLYAAGIVSFAQIAAWTEADVEEVEETVLNGRFAGRIRKDDWVGQARQLANSLG